MAVAARRAERLTDLVSTIRGQGGHSIAIPGDVSVETEAQEAVGKTIRELGQLDILVNCAGIIQAGNVEHAKLEEWRRVMEVNFFAALYTCNAVVGHMRELGRGDIINVSSISGRRSAVRYGAYAPSKHALNAMSEGLRQEVAPLGIRVCVIEPGATATEVAEAISDPAHRQIMRTHVHTQGTVQPQDVAGAIVFVASLPARANISELLIRPTTDIAPM